MEKPPYPLCDETKEIAKHLAEAWENEVINQYWRLVETTHGSGAQTIQLSASFGILKKSVFKIPPIGSLLELARYGLIQMTRQQERKAYYWEIVLLQELINAVAKDFEVSDYFLTVNAVGTIIHGDYIAHSGSGFQSAAINEGSMTFNNISSLAEGILDALGREVDNDEELQALIEEAKLLANASPQIQRGLASKLLSTLNKRIGTMSNSAGAIQLVANFLVAIEKLM